MRAPASLLMLIATTACAGEAEPAAPANGSPTDQAVSATTTSPAPSAEPPPSPVAPAIFTTPPPPALTAAELAMAGPPSPAPTEAPSAPGWDAARAASMRGDHQGVVRELEGSATSARELALLIEAHRQLGNTPAACRN